ncbi:MAG: hypothetical protein AB1Z51_04695 [Desulfuromonadales bacterium]
MKLLPDQGLPLHSTQKNSLFSFVPTQNTIRSAICTACSSSSGPSMLASSCCAISTPPRVYGCGAHMTQQGILELAAVLALQGDFTVVDDDAVHMQVLCRAGKRCCRSGRSGRHSSINISSVSQIMRLPLWALDWTFAI